MWNVLFDIRRLQLHEVDAEDHAQIALDDDRDRVGDQDRHRGPVALAQPPHEAPLDQHAEHEQRRHRDEQTDEQVDPQVHRQHVAQVGAQHDQRSLGDVDDVHHAEDQREPGGHQRIDAAGQHAFDDRLGSRYDTCSRSPVRLRETRPAWSRTAPTTGAPGPASPFCHWNIDACGRAVLTQRVELHRPLHAVERHAAVQVGDDLRVVEAVRRVDRLGHHLADRVGLGDVGVDVGRRSRRTWRCTP